jgi:prolyl oligopeptidase
MAWLERGGALAIAHVRGGGDLGEPWHQAAFKKTKPNSWRDLIDCARWLVAEKWTSPSKLIIQGRSAGGITVGRAVTEAPELFAAAIMRVPAVNTTRLHKSPAGPGNFPEFGDPANAEEFRNLVEMDAYLHVQKGRPYPPVLLTAGLNDGRIPVWVPGKMAARLQDDSCNPAVLRVETKGGHALGATRDQENGEKADIFAFAWWAAHRPSRCLTRLRAS